MKKKRLKIISIIMAYLFLFSSTAWAMPQDGKIISGNSIITKPDAQTMHVTQTSDKSIINWQGYSIGANEKVQYFQPGSNAISLNRVVGQDPSSIYGQLSANGQVWVINPNGLLIGSGAKINTGSFLGSTLNISNDDFLKGHYKFKQEGALASIKNLGSITSQNGGYVTLISPIIVNEGSITANLGKAYLASGSEVTLNFSGNDLIGFTVDKEAVATALGITNKGTITANGGEVILSAKVASAMMKTVVNNEGVIEAKTIAEKDGKIYLLGDMDHNTVAVSGTLDASANGGGNGGFIETSAARVKVADSAVVTTYAPYGKTGTWLIDPTDYTISATGDETGAHVSSSLGSTNRTIASSDGTTGVDGDINVNDAVSWSANKLTLTAARDVNINAVMTASGSSALEMNTAGSVAGGTVKVGFGGRVDFGTRSGTGFLTINTHDYMVINSLGSAGSVTGTDLQGIGGPGKLGGYYALGSDIDASGTSLWNLGAGFAPIGNYSNNFTGVFDGLGHTITGLTIARPTTNYVGLFGYTASGSVVRNVGLVGGSVTGKNDSGGLVGENDGAVSNSYNAGTVSGVSSIGGLVGDNYGAVSNSYNSGTVIITGTSANVGGLVSDNFGTITNSYNAGAVIGITRSLVGGLVGYNYYGASISNSYNTGTITTGAGFIPFVGGLVGENDGTISNSYNAGAVSSAGSTAYIGGLAGYNDGAISNSYNTGSVTGTGDTSKIGGLVGENQNAPITYSYNSGVVTSSGTGSVIGGLAGDNIGTGSIQNSFWDTATSGQSAATGGGSGTCTNCTGLATAALMTQSSYTAKGWDFTSSGSWWMSEGNTRPFLRMEYSTNIVNAHQLQLMALNLGASYRLTNNINMSELTLASGLWNITKGFVPVGDSTTKFTGVFDGLGHTISGMTINRPTTDNVGLFGYTASGSSISNVGLVGGSVSGQNNVGSLAGYSYGAISNSYNTGAVTGGTHGKVGGLVGAGHNGSITDSHNTGIVNGGNYAMAGGLMGENDGSIITNSYNTGAVTGGTSSIVGGLVAVHSFGSISNSYNTGTITGDLEVGGLVGESYLTSISNSHNSGKVNGTTNVGGLMGYNQYGAISNSYNSGVVTGTSNYVGGLVGQHLYAAISNSYNTGAVSSTGGNVGGLVGDNSHGATISDSYNTGAVTGTGDSVGGLVGHNQIGAITNSYNTGAVTETGAGAEIGGLVGLNERSTISNSYNTGIVTSTVTGTVVVGGLVGDNVGGAISDSHNTGAVSIDSGYYVGGLVGNNNGDSTHHGTISRSYNTGNVNSRSITGGLVGWNESYDSIDNSYNTGAVTGTGPHVGGLVGANLGDISNSHNTGAVNSAGNYVGGLAGGHHDGNISNSYNTGAVTETGACTEIGGLVGNNDNGTIANSYNTGAVNSTGTTVGGLVGYNEGGAISTSYNAGAVTGAGNVGGLAGDNDHGTITDSYNTGAVNGTGNKVGGLVGYNEFGAISTSYNAGAVTGVDNVGGLAGNNDGGSINDAYNIGAVTGANDVGGVVGHNSFSDGGTIINTYNSGLVSKTPSGAGANMGGLVGYNDPYSGISNSFWDTDTTGQTVAIGNGLGGCTNCTGLDTTTLMKQATYTAKLWDFNTIWWMSEDNTRPLLRMEYKTNIINTHQLQLMAMTPGATYTLANNIDMSELTNASGIWNTSKGFVPIGSSANPFTGSFNGQGHTINGLMINRPTEDDVGLFGYSGSGSTISNVGILNGDITGGNYVGGIVGYNNGAISNSYNTGYVTGSETGTVPTAVGAGGVVVSDIGGNYVGGIAGYSVGGTITGSHNSGAVTGVSYVGGLVGHNEGAITNSYNSGNVTGTGNKVGGLLGENWYSDIHTSYNTGSVNGTGDVVGGLIGFNWYSNVYTSYSNGPVTGRDYVGGLIGMSGCDVSESYSSGAVSGRNYVGGLIGLSFDNLSNTYSTGSVTGASYIGGLIGGNYGLVSYSYSIGRVTGGSYVGGLVGINYNSDTITSSFWNVTTSGQTHSDGSADTYGKSTEDMKKLSTFKDAGWDIAETTGPTGTLWRMKEGATYPLLRLFDPDRITSASVPSTTVATAPTPHVFDIYDLLKNKSGVKTEGGNPGDGLLAQQTPHFEIDPSVFGNE